MAPGFPFCDRRQRPTVMGPANALSSRGAGSSHAVPAPRDPTDRTGASAHGHPHVDIALVPGTRPHGDVLG